MYLYGLCGIYCFLKFCLDYHGQQGFRYVLPLSAYLCRAVGT